MKTKLKIMPAPCGAGIYKGKLTFAFLTKKEALQFRDEWDLEGEPFEPEQPIHVVDPWLIQFDDPGNGCIFW